MAPSFRRKNRNPAPRPEKENERIGADQQPLSPRLVRCRSDTTQRTCSEINLNKSSASPDVALSAEGKISNLMQLNAALVKEITSLRLSHTDACNKFSKLEASLRTANCTPADDLSSLQEETSILKEENAALLASQEELQTSLGTSRAQIEDLSMELAKVKVETDQTHLAQKKALAASEELLASATRELIALKENNARISSEKDVLFEEKEIALRLKEEAEEKLATMCKSESELLDLLQVEKKSSEDAQMKISMQVKEVEMLLNEKEALMCEATSHEREASQKIRSLEDSLQSSMMRVNRLTLQIEEEREKHVEALSSAEQESARRLSEVSKEIMLANQHLQASNEQVESLRMQLQKERIDHQDETIALQEKLDKSSQKVRAMEELLHESNASADAFRQQLLRDIELLKHDLSQCYIIKDALLSEKETLLSEKIAFEAEISSLRANAVNLSNETQDIQRVHAEKEQKLLAQLKQVERTVSDLEIEQNDLLKQLNMEKMAGAAAQERISTLESSKTTLVRDHFDTKEALLRELTAKERDISAMCDEVQNLSKQNARLNEQVAGIKLDNSNILLEKQRSVENLMALADDKVRALETISSLKHQLESLQLLKDQLTGESKSAKIEAEAVAMDNLRLSRDLACVQGEKAQLESRLSELSAELVQVRQRVEAAGVAQAKQDMEMGQLRNEITKLTSANTDLLSALKTHESEGKLLMLEVEKKEEQLAFLSRFSADLESSFTASQGEIARQKAACEVLESDNAVLQSSIETKAKALVALESQVDDSAKRIVALESQIEAMSSRHNALDQQLKSLQEEAMVQSATLDAERHEKLSLQRLMEDKKIEIERLREQARVNLDSLLRDKDNELGSLRANLAALSQKNSDLTTMLETCTDKNMNLEAQLRNIEAELATAKGEVLKAEKDVSAAAKLEGELSVASKRVSMLEHQLKAKVTSQNELEFQVISLQNDLQAAHIASAKAEKDWKANMDAVCESAIAQSKALEEQLESVKKTLEEMESSASKGKESIESLQDQVSCLMEEKCSLEKKVLRHARALDTGEHNAKEVRAEGGMPLQSQKRLDDKAKFVRLAVPVFLISAASSLVIAGLQSYLKKLEN